LTCNLDQGAQIQQLHEGEMPGYRAVTGSFLAVVLVVSCATIAHSQSGARAQADDTIPRNHRELIVKTILARSDARTIQRARISRPKVLWVGLLAGGNRQAICVEVIRKTLITSEARDVWAFTFKDGQIATASYTYANCEGYSPFPELLKQKPPLQ
jgi:hypothetical protein